MTDRWRSIRKLRISKSACHSTHTVLLSTVNYQSPTRLRQEGKQETLAISEKTDMITWRDVTKLTWYNKLTMIKPPVSCMFHLTNWFSRLGEWTSFPSHPAAWRTPGRPHCAGTSEKASASWEAEAGNSPLSGFSTPRRSGWWSDPPRRWSLPAGPCRCPAGSWIWASAGREVGSRRWPTARRPFLRRLWTPQGEGSGGDEEPCCLETPWAMKTEWAIEWNTGKEEEVWRIKGEMDSRFLLFGGEWEMEKGKRKESGGVVWKGGKEKRKEGSEKAFPYMWGRENKSRKMFSTKAL